LVYGLSNQDQVNAPAHEDEVWCVAKCAARGQKVECTEEGAIHEDEVWCVALSSVRCTWMGVELFERQVECTEEGAIHEDEVWCVALSSVRCTWLGCLSCSSVKWNAPKKVQSTKNCTSARI
jgi:hypothetical protein